MMRRMQILYNISLFRSDILLSLQMSGYSLLMTYVAMFPTYVMCVQKESLEYVRNRVRCLGIPDLGLLGDRFALHVEKK